MLLWPDIHLITQGYRVQARLRFSPEEAGAIETARDWLQSYSSTLGDALPVFGLGPVGAAEAYYQANLNWMRLQIVVGNHRPFSRISMCIYKWHRKRGWLGREIELTLIQAQMFHQQGQAEQALAALESGDCPQPSAAGMCAYSIKAPFWMISFILRLSEAFAPAISIRCYLPFGGQDAGAPASTSSATTVGETQKCAPAVEMAEPLSKRELEVLQMIASGATNQTIAERFVITVGTVKSHIHHIFGKLDARNRTRGGRPGEKVGLDRDGLRLEIHPPDLSFKRCRRFDLLVSTFIHYPPVEDK